MFNDARYNSGTSLSKTKKEQEIDYLENSIGDMSDELYLDLKKLNIKGIKELRNLVDQRLVEVGENAPIPAKE